MQKITSIIVIILLNLILSTQAFAGAADGITEIPRDYGPFKLGMSEAEFSRMTGITPEVCPVCLDRETFASVPGAQMQMFVSEHRNTQGVDFFFLNGELYMISRTPDTPALNVVQEELSQFFGANGKMNTKPNGVSTLTWENETTLVTVSFNQANNEVFSVNVEDWNLSQEKAWRESIMVEQTADMAK